MGVGSKARAWFAPPVITPGRVWFAMSVAVITDALQVLMGPLGWLGAVQVLDVLAMLLIVRAIGFHPLLLPTFVAELVPVVDFLPTWSGCTLAVLSLRKWHGKQTSSEGPVIETEATVSPVPPNPPPLPEKRLPPP